MAKMNFSADLFKTYDTAPDAHAFSYESMIVTSPTPCSRPAVIGLNSHSQRSTFTLMLPCMILNSLVNIRIRTQSYTSCENYLAAWNEQTERKVSRNSPINLYDRQRDAFFLFTRKPCAKFLMKGILCSWSVAKLKPSIVVALLKFVVIKW